MNLKVIKFGLLLTVALSISLIILKFYYIFTDLISRQRVPPANITTDQVLEKTNSLPSLVPVRSPQRIRFPSLNKELYIQQAQIIDNTWQLFPDKVSWLTTSSIPGEGNVILYAHNLPQLFGDLYQLRLDDTIQVEQYSQWLDYRVTEVKRINPIDTQEILADKNQLTLYTCAGSFDEKRLVIHALPASNSATLKVTNP